MNMAEGETLEGKVEGSASGRQSSLSSFDYRVPYSSCISNEQHEEIRNRVEKWLLEKNICSKKDLERVWGEHTRIINKHRWEMMRDNPDQYWAMVYAYALGPSLEKGKIFSKIVKPLLSDPSTPKSPERYYKNQLAWDCVGICLFRNKNGRDPTREEENTIAIRNSPIYRAAYAIWRGITGKELDYSWADEVVQCEKAKKVRKVEEREEEKGRCSVCQSGNYQAGACA
jgi:hypothetical protein